MENKPASLLLCHCEGHLAGLPHLGVLDRWPVTPKRACYSALTQLKRWDPAKRFHQQHDKIILSMLMTR